MATDKIHLTGEVEWCQHLVPDTKFEQHYYKLNLFPDKKSTAIYNDSGLRLKFKENERGKYITLRRPVEKEFNAKGGGKEMRKFGPPKTWLKGTEVDFTGKIGNGSVVTVEVTVYDTKAYGKGHRLEAIRIDKLIEYNPEGSAPEGEKKKGMPF